MSQALRTHLKVNKTALPYCDWQCEQDNNYKGNVTKAVLGQILVRLYVNLQEEETDPG